MITADAYAKVNLSLDIVGRREDGYHLVRMVMQSLDIKDKLTLEKIDVTEGEDPIKIFLKDGRADIQNQDQTSSGQADSLGTLPEGKDNLIYKVARLMMEKYVWKRYPGKGIVITLEKHIPIAAGMAGGSSDAAATFKGINRLFELGLMEQDLMKLGVQLGADIPRDHLSCHRKKIRI